MQKGANMNLIKFNDACKKLSVSRASLYRIMRADLSFPRPIKLTVGINVFNESEIEQWIELKSKEQKK